MATVTKNRKSSAANNRTSSSTNKKASPAGKKSAATAKKASPAKKAATKQSARAEKMPHSEFHKFFLDELKDIYWAEKALVKALPKLKKASTSPELAAAFDKHAGETQTHVSTLENIFEILGEKAVAKKCDAMQGLIEEANSVIEETEAGSKVRDAALILAAQKAEHYEIATYGSLRVFASTMGHGDVEQLLSQTLENEKATDEALTALAEGAVNDEASEE
ncbi:ferritin-like domain-containing protein [Chitinophaga sp. Ak27]|uniref:YciE/YciF ferroxidase family protein n=1 Tax=Chitinophaga sp. Ak27 TaxID=2726116 RepID=UPI00145D768F|nr:ferritin-like domain-containing protein [Chitinophaga sp. Ak27]NLU90671.1 ferritin-like domain-containing protein [Chitinophaga sp. Ak27]